MFCCAVLSVLSSFANTLVGRSFTLIVFLVSCDCDCSVALPRGVVGWSVVCNCSISWWLGGSSSRCHGVVCRL